MRSETRGRTTRRRAIALSTLPLALMALPRVASAAHQVLPWAPDTPTPAVNLRDLDGRSWELSAFKGRVVALNFWATWCEPCREEMPSLQRLQISLGTRGLKVVTVNYKQPLPEIRRFLDAVPLDLTILLDPDGDAAAEWTPRVFPSTVLVDRRGQARTTVLGGLDWTGLEARRLLDPLLAMPA